MNLTQLKLRADQLGQMLCVAPEGAEMLEAELEQVNSSIAALESEARKAVIAEVAAVGQEDLVRGTA